MRKQTKLNIFFPLFNSYVLIASLWFVSAAQAQNLPDEIRGYKVHKAKITVANRAQKSSEKDDSEATVRLDEPELTDTSLSGVTFEISGQIADLKQSGTVDFLTFKDFTVNGIAVQIADFNESFEFKKNKNLILPKPIGIFVSTAQTLRGALGEIRNPQSEWLVTGKVFVFGRFKKWGMNFKRVVPVEVNVKIKNPLRKDNNLSSASYLSF